MIKISIKSGIITLLLMFLYIGIVALTKIKNFPIPGIEYLILGAGIYSSHYFYKLENQYMSYSNGIKLGLGVTSTVGFILGTWSFIYSAFIDSNFIVKTTKNIAPMLKQKGFDENSIKIAVDQITKHFTPVKLFFAVIITFLIIGLVMSLIISMFSKKRLKQYD